MISSSHNIKEFIEAVKDKDYFELIYLADKEALEVWRKCKNSKERMDCNQEKSSSYEISLKKFIAYLRASIAPNRNTNREIALFHSVYERQIKKLPRIRFDS